MTHCTSVPVVGAGFHHSSPMSSNKSLADPGPTGGSLFCFFTSFLYLAFAFALYQIIDVSLTETAYLYTLPFT